MANLIKSDLLRIVKDKLFLITCIIAVGFAVTTPILTYALLRFVGIEDEGLMGMVANGKSTFFGAFSPSNNLGLVLPILISVILCKDFSQGTIRNKLIAGKRRSDVFLSMYISAATVITGLILCYALLTLGISLIFMDYQTEAFTASDFGYLMLSLLFEILVYLLITAIVCFICVFTRNIGLCILLYVGVMMLFTIIGSIVQVAFVLMSSQDAGYWLVEFLNDTNIFTSTLIGYGTEYDLKDVLYATIPPVVETVGLLLLGNLVFRKKDLK